MGRLGFGKLLGTVLKTLSRVILKGIPLTAPFVLALIMMSVHYTAINYTRVY